MAAPLTGRTPSQLGIVVDDLDAALEELGGTLGDGWAILRDGASLVPYRTADGVQEYPMRVVEGLAGPPYVELIQAIEGSTWAPRGGSYLHHVAYEVEDLEATCSELERQGYELVLTQAGEARLQTFGLYRAPTGLLFEIVDAAVVGGRRVRN
jgi:catechol 2,3-dioxygenase-like lactoylglutathione lyase family enzyme